MNAARPPDGDMRTYVEQFWAPGNTYGSQALQSSIVPARCVPARANRSARTAHARVRAAPNSFVCVNV